LRSHGPDTPGAIAARECVQPPSMTRTLNHLVDLGLAQRTPHPSDGRHVMVSISEAGHDVLAAAAKRRDEWRSCRLAELTTSERATLRSAAALLERLAAS